MPVSPSSPDNSISLRVPARLENVRRLTRMVSDLALQADLSERAVYHCRLAMDEACTNIIEHAYPTQDDGEIAMQVTLQEDELVILLTDFGLPYDPANVPHPPTHAPLDRMRPGGLGLHIMRTVMDDIQYRVSNSGNHLRMVKRRLS
ncbi:MAG: ATP-binding protein [Chloroflexi bacterium]|nr:ATP-binding protein [Chloroflexota bacterium]